MLPNSPDTELFKKKIKKLFDQEAKNCRTFTISKNENVYTCGDKSTSIYYIVNGQIKIVTNAPNGKECILSIHRAGSIFGEQSLANIDERVETAIAMKTSAIKEIPKVFFLSILSQNFLFEDFLEHMADTLIAQQEVITNFVTANSEIRLAITLLKLAKQIDTNKSDNMVIQYKITHEELSNIIGTTRPRVSEFMRRFRNQKLIDITTNHLIIVKKNLTVYLDKAIYAR